MVSTKQPRRFSAVYRIKKRPRADHQNLLRPRTFIAQLRKRVQARGEPETAPRSADGPCPFPVEGCARLPGLPGVRKSRSGQFDANVVQIKVAIFGRRAQGSSAAMPALRALDTADTGSPSQGTSRTSQTFARSRRDLSIPDIGEQPAVVVDGVAHV